MPSDWPAVCVSRNASGDDGLPRSARMASPAVGKRSTEQSQPSIADPDGRSLMPVTLARAAAPLGQLRAESDAGRHHDRNVGRGTARRRRGRCSGGHQHIGLEGDKLRRRGCETLGVPLGPAKLKFMAPSACPRSYKRRLKISHSASRSGSAPPSPGCRCVEFSCLLLSAWPGGVTASEYWMRDRRPSIA